MIKNYQARIQISTNEQSDQLYLILKNYIFKSHKLQFLASWNQEAGEISTTLDTRMIPL